MRDLFCVPTDGWFCVPRVYLGLRNSLSSRSIFIDTAGFQLKEEGERKSKKVTQVDFIGPFSKKREIHLFLLSISPVLDFNSKILRTSKAGFLFPHYRDRAHFQRRDFSSRLRTPKSPLLYSRTPGHLCMSPTGLGPVRRSSDFPFNRKSNSLLRSETPGRGSDRKVLWIPIKHKPSVVGSGRMSRPLGSPAQSPFYKVIVDVFLEVVLLHPKWISIPVHSLYEG